MPIHRSDYHLLGFSWEGEYYYDKAVPFGASSSCGLFEATSKALEWIAITKLGCMAVGHILDDFLFLNLSHIFNRRILFNIVKIASVIVSL